MFELRIRPHCDAEKKLIPLLQEALAAAGVPFTACQDWDLADVSLLRSKKDNWAITFAATQSAQSLIRFSWNMQLAMQLAWKDVVSKGYRRIGFAAFGFPLDSTASACFAEFLRLQRQESKCVELEPFICRVKENVDSRFRSWISHHNPDMIFGSETLAMEMVRQAGPKVPQDIGWFSLDSTTGPHSRFAFDWHSMARKIASLCQSQELTQFCVGTKVQLPVSLHVGNTTPAKKVRQVREKNQRITLFFNPLHFSRLVEQAILEAVYSRKLPWVLNEVSLPHSFQNFLRTERPDGIIGMFSRHSQLADLAVIPFPAVNVSGTFRDHPLPTVTANNIEIGQLAAHYLRSRGYRSFACVYSSNLYLAELRKQGFVANISTTNFPLALYETQFYVATDMNTGTSISQNVETWLKSLPLQSAIFCFNDGCASFIRNTCLKLGIAIPSQMALLGVDDDPNIGQIEEPFISSCRMPASQIAWEAVSTMEKLLNGESVAKETLIAPPGIHEMTSTNWMALQDPLLAKALAVIHEEGAAARLSVDDLARLVGLNRRSLERRFEEVLHTSPYAEIRYQRLNLAKNKLLHTNLTVSEIAEICGFSSPQRMAELFKEKLATTPSEFRQKNVRP